MHRVARSGFFSAKGQKDGRTMGCNADEGKGGLSDRKTASQVTAWQRDGGYAGQEKQNGGSAVERGYTEGSWSLGIDSCSYK